jgi:beta-glucosidase
LRRASSSIDVSVSVTNTSRVAADEVVQVYCGFPGRIVDRPKKLLRGFHRISLEPGATATAHFEVPLDTLRWYDASSRCWRLEPGAHTFYAGGSSRDADLLCREIIL